MATLLLVRHGRTTANAAGLLAGRTPGVSLDDLGVAQADQLGARLAAVPLAAILSSPLQRCRETSAPLTAGRDLSVVIDERLNECDYGTWTGRPIADLSDEPLWRTVQAHPSAVTFPGGESMAGMQARAVAAVREHDATISDVHGPEAVWVAVAHGDIIKAILADALGMHLDLFQRIGVDPCSVSVIRYTPMRPFVLRMNDTGSDLTSLVAQPGSHSGDAVVGGGAGPVPATPEDSGNVTSSGGSVPRATSA